MKFDLLVLSKKRLGGNLKSLRWKLEGVGMNTCLCSRLRPSGTVFGWITVSHENTQTREHKGLLVR